MAETKILGKSKSILAIALAIMIFLHAGVVYSILTLPSNYSPILYVFLFLLAGFTILSIYFPLMVMHSVVINSQHFIHLEGREELKKISWKNVRAVQLEQHPETAKKTLLVLAIYHDEGTYHLVQARTFEKKKMIQVYKAISDMHGEFGHVILKYQV